MGIIKVKSQCSPIEKNLHLAFMEGDKNEIRFKKVISIKSNFSRKKKGGEYRDFNKR